MQKLPNLASQNTLAFKLAAISCEKKFGKIGFFVDISLLFLITYIVNIQTPPGVLRTGAEWDDTQIQGGTNENGTHGTKIIWCEKATNRNRARIRDFKIAPLPPLPENFFTGPLCLPPPPPFVPSTRIEIQTGSLYVGCEGRRGRERGNGQGRRGREGKGGGPRKRNFHVIRNKNLERNTSIGKSFITFNFLSTFLFKIFKLLLYWLFFLTPFSRYNESCLSFLKIAKKVKNCDKVSDHSFLLKFFRIIKSFAFLRIVPFVLFFSTVPTLCTSHPRFFVITCQTFYSFLDPFASYEISLKKLPYAENELLKNVNAFSQHCKTSFSKEGNSRSQKFFNKNSKSDRNDIKLTVPVRRHGWSRFFPRSGLGLLPRYSISLSINFVANVYTKFRDVIKDMDKITPKASHFENIAIYHLILQYLFVPSKSFKVFLEMLEKGSNHYYMTIKCENKCVHYGNWYERESFGYSVELKHKKFNFLFRWSSFVSLYGTNIFKHGFILEFNQSKIALNPTPFVRCICLFDYETHTLKSKPVYRTYPTNTNYVIMTLNIYMFRSWWTSSLVVLSLILNAVLWFLLPCKLQFDNHVTCCVRFTQKFYFRNSVSKIGCKLVCFYLVLTRNKYLFNSYMSFKPKIHGVGF